MSDRPYRAALPEQADQRLVFYPHFAPLWGVLGVLVALGSVLVVFTFRASAVWAVTPLLLVMIYATRGERHEVAVSELRVSVRRGLWPLRGRERLLNRSDVVAVLLEEYDGEARIALQTRRDGKLTLTEAFLPKADAERVQEKLQQVIFPAE